MNTLDLKKNNYLNFEKLEIDEPDYRNVEQNINRSWRFLQITHNLKEGECLCIRALATKTNEYDKWCIPKEHIIFNYSPESYKEFKKFMISKIKGKRIYNFFYNIYNINVKQAWETCKENEGGFFGKSCNASSTSIIICDFDNFSKEDYIKLKNDFIKRGLDGTVDIFSGHGFHICFRLSENSTDELLLLKFIKVLQENGYTPDLCVFDPARVMRLPFFYNQKPSKYTTVSLSEIAEGEYNSRLFTVNEIFQKFGYDYEKFDLDKYYKKKKAGRPKKSTTKKKKERVEFDDNKDISEDYDIDVNVLPEGIKNMLRAGLVQGYANLETMTLTLFFKNMGLTLKHIKNIMKKIESINGNSWNTWDMNDEVERFFRKYDYVNKYVILELEAEFGKIRFINKNTRYRVPVKMDSKQTELYLYLLQNGDSKKVEILEDMEISNNKLDRIMENNNLVTINNRIYSINKDLQINEYIEVDGLQMEKLNNLNDKERAIYTYLKWRSRADKTISVSIESIRQHTMISLHTISDTLKELEKKKLIKVTRYIFDMKTNSKKVNEYKIL